MGLKERGIEAGVGLSASDVLANAAGTGVSLDLCWLVLLESRRLSHFIPIGNLVFFVEWCGLVSPIRCHVKWELVLPHCTSHSVPSTK